MGGAVRGGLDGAGIHGRFPADLTAGGDRILSRGRVVPTMPWEGIWHGVAQWLGAGLYLTTLPTRSINSLILSKSESLISVLK